MRKEFPEYFTPTEQEFNTLWNESYFVFDTNVLLNVYRFSAPTRESFLTVLSSVKDRIWAPHRVAEEFLRNRAEVIIKQNSIYDEISDKTSKHIEKAKTDAKECIRHPLLDKTEIDNILDLAQTKLTELIESKKSQHPNLLESDPYVTQLVSLFENRIGPAYAATDGDDKKKAALDRITKRIPPGYMDSSKEEDKQIGDVLVWLQILDFAADKKKPVILVTDDRKEDWWYQVNGKTLGPRPELVKEFRSISGKSFYMYNSERFLEYSTNYIASISPEQDKVKAAAQEVRVLREQDSEQIERRKRMRLREHAQHSLAHSGMLRNFPHHSSDPKIVVDGVEARSEGEAMIALERAMFRELEELAEQHRRRVQEYRNSRDAKSGQLEKFASREYDERRQDIEAKFHQRRRDIVTYFRNFRSATEFEDGPRTNRILREIDRVIDQELVRDRDESSSFEEMRRRIDDRLIELGLLRRRDEEDL